MENENKRELNNNNNGSQNITVSPFANSPMDKKEANNIKTRLESSRSRNLNNNANTNNLNGLNNTNKPSSLGEKPSIEDDNGKTGIFNKKKKDKNVSTTTSENSNPIEKKESKKNNNKKSGLLNSIGGLISNKGKSLLSNNEEINEVTDPVSVIGKFASIARRIITILISPIGIVLLVILILFFVIMIIVNIFGILIDSLGMKFGLSGEEVLKIYGDEYIENLTIEEIEEIMSNNDVNMCELSFIQRVKFFFGMEDLTDNCELAHYVKNLLNDKESSTGIPVISPGYFMSSLYYSFDTQNRNENGDLYIKPKDYIDNDGSLEEIDYINDLDAITTLIGVQLYNKKNFDDLLDNYVFYENLTTSSKSIERADGSNSIVNGYPYYIYTYFPPTTPNGSGHWECVQHTSSDYYIDDLKFKLYLRYGQKVVDNYVNEKNMDKAYNKTSSECQVYTKPDLNKYEKMANPDEDEDDNAKITINDKTYGYDSGFIFKTYPKFNEKYTINGKVNYDYRTDKNIEQIIRFIESRQDYTNYLLGYPSNVKTELSYNSGLSGGSCTYKVNGIDMSNVKVRLTYGKNDPEGLKYQPIEGQELLNFEDYITGVVYSEISGKEEEASKVQAIAARSYAFAYGEFYNKLKEENGQWILEMVNSNEAQAYCDPNKGCYKRCDGGYNAMFTVGTEPPGISCQYLPPISDDSVIRKAVRETAGMILLNNEGKPEVTNNRGVFGYRDIDQDKWIEMASNGSTYEEILKYAYPNGKLTTNDCTILASDWVAPLSKMTKVNSCFGGRYIFGSYNYHGGVDLAASLDDPIYATASGKVIVKGINDPTETRSDWSYGNYIMIDHGNGYVSIYAHMNKHVSTLNVNDTVTAGQQIGYAGTTGRSTGVHLHFEMRYNGKKVDPLVVIDPTHSLKLTGDCR